MRLADKDFNPYSDLEIRAFHDYLQVPQTDPNQRINRKELQHEQEKYFLPFTKPALLLPKERHRLRQQMERYFCIAANVYES